MDNLGYILKRSVVSACEPMNDNEFRETIMGLFNYAVNGENPNFTTPLQNAVFIMEKPSIDRNNMKWAEKRESYENGTRKTNKKERKYDDNNEMPF